MKQSKCTNIKLWTLGHKLSVRAFVVVLCFAFSLISLQVKASPTIGSSSPNWEQVNTSPSIDDNDKIEVTIRDGYIYVSTPKTINVKIFSILGQLISSTRVNVGTSRLKVPSRGIYILKAGDYTRRITI